MDKWEKDSLKAVVEGYLKSEETLYSSYAEVASLKATIQVQKYLDALKELEAAKIRMDYAKTDLESSLKGTWVIKLDSGKTVVATRYEVTEVEGTVEQ